MPGVVYKISGDNSQFQKDVNQSETIAQGGFDKITALGIAAWAAIGAAIIKVTSAGMSFIKDSVNVGMGFDKSMSQVAATMGTTVDQIQDLSNFALEMGATTAFSAQQAADGLNILAMSGLNAQEQMATLPEVLNLAASGGLDLATAASYVTGAVKGWGDSFSNSAKYTDMIATGAAKANTNVNQLGLALSDSAATSASYGQTAEGTTLALLRLAEQNVTGAEAATALNRAMMDLYTPTDNAKKALDKLGVSAYDSTGKARPLNDVIDDLTVAMDGMSDAEKNAAKNAIFSTFGLQAYNKMTVSTKAKVDDFRRALDKSAGSAEKMAKVQLDNLAGDITLAKSAAEGFKISISNGVTPAIRQFVQKGTTELGKLKSAFDKDGLSGLASQLSDSLLTMIGELGKHLPKIASTALQFGKEFVLKTGQALVNNADKILQGAASLATKIGEGIVKGLPQIGSLIGKGLAKLFLNLPSLVEGGFNLIMGIANGIWDGIGALADGISEGLEGSMEKPMLSESEAVRGIIDGVTASIDKVKDHIGSLPDAIEDADAEFQLANDWVDTFERLRDKTNLTVTEEAMLLEAIENLNAILPEGAQIVQDDTGAWVANTAEIRKNIDLLHERAKAEALAEYTKDLYKDILTLQRQRNDVEQEINDRVAKQKELNVQIDYYKEALGGVKTALDNVKTAVLNGDASTIDWKSTWDSLPQSVKDVGTQIGVTSLDGVGDLGKLYNAIQDVLGSEYDGSGLQGAYAQNETDIASLKNSLKDIDLQIANTRTALENAKSGAYAAGVQTGSGYASGISSQAGSVSAAASGLANAAVRSMTRTLAIKSPSKVTQKIGRYVTEGLALGIGDDTEINKVEQSADKAANAGLMAMTSSIDSSINSAPITGTETGKIDMIITLLTKYLPEMGGDIVLDTGALVGHTIGRTDEELGQLQKRRARYE